MDAKGSPRVSGPTLYLLLGSYIWVRVEMRRRVRTCLHAYELYDPRSRSPYFLTMF